MRLFFHIAYDGHKYRGWQRQPKVRSVQEFIEDRLKKIFKKDITVFGCGRTDAEVHASQYFFHINLENKPDFDLKFRLNKNLPDDIAVFDIFEMGEKQHTRYDASLRVYDYFIHQNKDPFFDKYSSFYQLGKLDFSEMQKAATLFLKYDDFRSICKSPNFYDHTICKIAKANLFINEKEERLRFEIGANRFLRGMVRLSVSYLLKVGQGKMSVDEFEHIFSNKIEASNLVPAKPHGLYLSKVEYPYMNLEPRQGLCYFLKTGLS